MAVPSRPLYRDSTILLITGISVLDKLTFKISYIKPTRNKGRHLVVPSKPLYISSQNMNEIYNSGGVKKTIDSNIDVMKKDQQTQWDSLSEP